MNTTTNIANNHRFSWSALKCMVIHRKREVLIAAGVTVLAIFIGVGFNSKIHETAQCSALSTIKMIANYSETTTAIDMEGNPYIDTDYWTEDASNTYYVEMLNLDVIKSNIAHTMSGNIAVPIGEFQYDETMKRDRHFDSFSVNRNSEIHQSFADGEYVSIKPSQYEECFLNIGSMVEVKYWYQFAYGV